MQSAERPSHVALMVVVGMLALVGSTCRSDSENRHAADAAVPASASVDLSVQMPAYEGVDQLLLLSSRWVIVATRDLDDVIARVNELSGGELMKMVKLWEESSAKGKPNWTAYKGRARIRDKYMAQAREMIGERKLGRTDFFQITSPDDPAYAKPARPTRTTRILVPLGGGRVPGGPNIDYAHYSYLEMPTALVNGRRYTITLGNGKKVTFLYDELRTVSRAIKVNQVGYLPDAGKKYAYLGGYLYEFGPVDFASVREFKVVSTESGEVALTGKVELLEKNPRFAPRPGKSDDPAKRPLMYGEDVYRLDLTGLKAEGEFFLSIPGVGRSWPFRHAKDVYGEAFYIAARGLYHQRCGIALTKRYTPWTRIKSPMHTTIYASDNVAFPVNSEGLKGNHFDIIGSTIREDVKIENARGGWHDAADWDRNQYHYSCIFDLLNAYEFAPKKFVDAQLNIPESGNGIPDVLDEAEFGLEIWKRTMDARGGVSGVIETWTHPKIDDPKAKYTFARRTRWNSLMFAAAAAQLAHLVKPFDARKSAEYAALAQKAYAFGNDPANSLGKIEIKVRKNRGRGAPYVVRFEEKDQQVRPYLVHARLRLFVLTGEKSYLDGLAELAATSKKPYGHRFTYKDFSPWMYFDIVAAAAKDLPADTVAAWRKFYLDDAKGLLDCQKDVPYRYSIPRHKDYWLAWGGSDVTNYNRPLLIAYKLTGKADYRDAAVANADFMLGANPMGMSWTTGLGQVYPVHIQHANSEDDDILDPVPGITLYGTTGGPMYRAFRQTVWQSPGKDGPVSFLRPANRHAPFWRRWASHPNLNVGQCEFTVHETMASTIFTTALLSPDGWRPSVELKNRQPRPDDKLFGYWYLP